jgi:nicotinate-nucleotide adenylyltransferase
MYGGTFDPIHNGHLAVAAAVEKVFRPEKILLVPNDQPPHRSLRQLTAYAHRYAMVALAAAGQPHLAASVLESPHRHEPGAFAYSIDTVRHLREEMAAEDRLLFVIGADAFLDIAKWRSPVELLRACEIVAVSRPGFSLEEALTALPRELLAAGTPELHNRRWAGGRVLRVSAGGATIHLLEGVASKVSATGVRQAVQQKQRFSHLVPLPVAEYIRKAGLYLEPPAARR